MTCKSEEKFKRHIVEILEKSENLKQSGMFYEYILKVKSNDNLRIIDKNAKSKNSNISVVEACRLFLDTKQKTLTAMSLQAYKTFAYSKIIPYFKKFKLEDITVQDIQDFKRYLQENKVSEHRIRNILCLLNQIIKHFQNEGYIERTCVFEIKRLEKIPKREIQILSAQQLAKLFKITKKEYPYLLPIIQKVIKLKQPLNSILTGNEREINSLKRKIRKDFCKIKKEMNLENYMFDDLLLCSYN